MRLENWCMEKKWTSIPVVASLQEPLKTLISWYSCPRIVPYHRTGLVCMNNRKLQKWWRVTSEARSQKTLQLRPCFSWIILSGQIQLPHHKDTQGVLWKCPLGEELKPLVNNQLNCQACEWAILEVNPPAQSRGL